MKEPSIYKVSCIVIGSKCTVMRSTSQLVDVVFYRAMLCIRGTSHGPVSVRHKSVFY